jgi:hypothetical protein
MQDRKKSTKATHFTRKALKRQFELEKADETTDEGPKNCNRPTSFLGLLCVFCFL